MRVITVAAFVASLVAHSSAQVPRTPQAPSVPGIPRVLQQPQGGTARLAGRVVSAESGRPIRRAVVRVVGADAREARSVSTEPDGKWEIKELPAGKYSIAVQKGGYVPLAYGQRRPFEQGRQVEVSDGQSIDDIDVALPKGGVVTGRIVDEFGEPVAGARIAAMRPRFMQGQRRLMPAGGQGTTDTTDDIGQYRLHGLTPGEYYVSATLGAMPSLDVSADRIGYASTYYPGTTIAAEAHRVPVGVGQEASEINFALAATRLAKVSGSVIGTTGNPVANTMVMLISTGAAVGMAGSPLVGMAQTKHDGTFTISNVAPGEYRLEMVAVSDLERLAQTGSNSSLGATQSASMPLAVAGDDVPNVTLTLLPTSGATGRIVFEGQPPDAAALANVTVFGLSSMPTAVAIGGTARIQSDGTFELKGLSGQRLFRVTPPTGWHLKSVRLNDADVTDTPVVCKPGEDLGTLAIVLSKTPATLTGSVQDAKGQPTADYVAVVFSSDSQRWGIHTRFIRRARPDQKGAFTIAGLPPDDYLAVAVEHLEPGDEGDPEILERLRDQATRVTIAEGQPKTIALKVVRTPGT